MQIVGAVAGNAPRLAPGRYEVVLLAGIVERKTARSPHLTVAEAAALIERLQGLTAQRHLSEDEAAAMKKRIIADVG